MKSGPFIELLAVVLGQEPKVVKLLSRYLKEAGQLTSGARGVNAPHMQPKDLATMIICLLADGKAMRGFELFEYFANMQLIVDDNHPDHPAGFDLLSSQLPDPNHTLLDLMVLLCDPEFELSPADDFQITFEGSRLAEIKYREFTITYWSRNAISDAKAAYLAGDDENFALSLMKRVGISESRTLYSDDLLLLKAVAFSSVEDPQLPVVNR